MTGKRYYLMNFAAWQRHAPHCAESHFIVLADAAENSRSASEAPVGAGFRGFCVPTPLSESPVLADSSSLAPEVGPFLESDATHLPCTSQTAIVGAGFSPALDVASSRSASSESEALILVLVAADEAAHIALENDAEVEALPHPLARTPVSQHAAAALAHFGVTAGDDTFTVAEKLACVHPLLKHRVF